MTESADNPDPVGCPPGRKTSYSRDELLACARGELFEPDSGRLPLPDMLMTDRINLITNEGGKYGRGQIKAELDINPDLWFSGWTRCGNWSGFSSCGPAKRAAAGPWAAAR